RTRSHPPGSSAEDERNEIESWGEALGTAVTVTVSGGGVSRRVGISLLCCWVQRPGNVVVDLDRVAAVGDEVVVVGTQAAQDLVAGDAVLGERLDVVAFEVLGAVTAADLARLVAFFDRDPQGLGDVASPGDDGAHVLAVAQDQLEE